MTTQFKKGDKVVCLDPLISGGMLKEGEVYTVSVIAQSSVILEETGYYAWKMERFKLHESLAPSKELADRYRALRQEATEIAKVFVKAGYHCVNTVSGKKVNLADYNLVFVKQVTEEF